MGQAVLHGTVISYVGSIHAYSELNQGATFNICLPATKLITYNLQSLPVDLPQGNDRILLKDYEPNLVKVGRLLLEKIGYRASIVNGGEAALEKCKQTSNVEAELARVVCYGLGAEIMPAQNIPASDRMEKPPA